MKLVAEFVLFQGFKFAAGWVAEGTVDALAGGVFVDGEFGFVFGAWG